MKQIKYVHHSIEKIHYLYDIEAQNKEFNRKPKGLWISVEDDENNWKSWCEGEGFRLGDYYKYEIELYENSNILFIDNNEKLIKFNDDYKGTSYKYYSVFSYIDWNLVSNDYNGIIISPYLYTHRLDMSVSWYYGWDCASGCIWNCKNTIKNIKLIGKEEFKEFSYVSLS